MIIKNPKPAYRRWLKKGALTLFVIEAVCFAGSYFVWHRINTERDYRRYLHDNYPSILEAFYKTGELIDSKSNIRQIDQAYWNEDKING
ncbi:protein CEBPZOS [Anoplophora glabripennis]|uniref:protein CEBPZOS n=1 Tax=Anoplophora glabripennis TaxID=217634 RepID=UPI000875864C|nr:protein CEBPZOS [Anoplophora glabripennis]